MGSSRWGRIRGSTSASTTGRATARSTSRRSADFLIDFSLRRAIVGGVRLRLVTAGALLLLASTAATAGAHVRYPDTGIHKIKHVIVIVQENRSFDSYFGTYPGADGIPKHVCVPDPLRGGCERPFHNAKDRNAGGPHDHIDEVRDVAGGRMNGFVRQAEVGRTHFCRVHINSGACSLAPKHPD